MNEVIATSMRSEIILTMTTQINNKTSTRNLKIKIIIIIINNTNSIGNTLVVSPTPALMISVMLGTSSISTCLSI